MPRLVQLVLLFVLATMMPSCSREPLRLRPSTAPARSAPVRSAILPSLPDITNSTARPLRVATYNAGLAVGVLPHARERASYVVEALAGLEVDFMCLQELWLDTHWRALIAAAGPRFPHASRPEPHRASTASCTRAELAPAARCVGEHCGGEDDESRLECIVKSCGHLAWRMSRQCLSCVSRDPLRSFEQVQTECLATGKNSAPAVMGPTLGASHGLGMLSRLPLVERDVLELESSLEPRAVLYAKLDSETVGTVHTFCTHLTPIVRSGPGGSSEPERIQARQIDALLAFVARKARPGELTVLLGDLNTGPDVPGPVRGRLPHHYARFAQAGFENPMLLLDEPPCTYCYDNPVVGGRSSDGLLIDHVLLRDFLGTARVQRILDERIVLEALGRRVESTYSDHYGLLVTLEP
jgi:endonuclease/exonuclease/phosphatase family metal-dependent hydrolase